MALSRHSAIKAAVSSSVRRGQSQRQRQDASPGTERDSAGKDPAGAPGTGALNNNCGLVLKLWHLGLHAQPGPTLCDPTDCSLPGSSVHGIILARIQEWVPISSCRGPS